MVVLRFWFGCCIWAGFVIDVVLFLWLVVGGWFVLWLICFVAVLLMLFVGGVCWC